MDLNKLNANDKVKLCKQYFYIGLALLPFVWITNFCWFFNEAFKAPPSATRSIIKKYVVLSGIGIAFWIIVLITWESIFQSYRAEGHAWSDYISFVFPTGRV